jgi:hypothetical protein
MICTKQTLHTGSYVRHLIVGWKTITATRQAVEIEPIALYRLGNSDATLNTRARVAYTS